MIKDTGREQRTAVVVRALVKEIDGYTLHSPNPYGLWFRFDTGPGDCDLVGQADTRQEINQR